MSILDKFNKIEIKNDNRISEEDRIFCKQQQDIYCKIIENYTIIFNDLIQLDEKENKMFEEIKDINKHSNYNHHFVDIGSDSLSKEIAHTHNIFIDIIISYFKGKYNVALEIPEYNKFLKLEKPVYKECYGWGKYSDEEIEKIKQRQEEYDVKLKEYEQQIFNARLNYNSIIDEIFIQLDGYSFTDKAEQEIINNCKKACHNSYYNYLYFEVKNNKIIFNILSSYKCTIWNRYQISLDGTNYLSILKALTYYDSDKLNTNTYGNWDKFIDYKKTEEDGIYNKFEVYGNKITHFKYFKNGKWEISFKNSEQALQFAKEYCGYTENIEQAS